MKKHEKRVAKKVHEFIGIENEDWLENFKDWIKSLFVKKDVHLTVGLTGDYQTLNEAINHIKKMAFFPLKVEITLLSDFVMKEQVLLEDIDLSFVTIKSSGTVNVESIDMKECIRVNAFPEFEIVPVLYGKNASLPTLDVKFMYISSNIFSDKCIDCNKIVSGLLLDNSTVFIKPNNGFTHFPYIGLGAINGSHATAHHCDFSHNGNRNELSENQAGQEWYGDGVRTWNSSFSGSYAIANRCGDMGFHFSNGSNANINKATAIDCGHHAILVTSGSICSARNGVFTDTIDDNVVAYASSKIDLRNSDCSRSKVNYGVIATRTSEINFENGIANGCGYSGIMANRGSSIDATNGIANNNEMHGIESANSSRVDFSNGTVVGNKEDGLHSTHGSVIQARLSSIRNNVRNGILAFGGMVYANGSSVLNSGNRNIEATRGGFVSANRSIVDGAGEKGVLAFGGNIHVNDSEIKNSQDRQVEATQGGEVQAVNCIVSGSSGNAFNVYFGGRIFAGNTQGTANRDLNELTEHGYIISDTLVRG